MKASKSISSKRIKKQNDKKEGNDRNSNLQQAQQKETKQRKTSSLQGRPAKANPQLRQMEKEIKQVQWRFSELEECLYLQHGGASASHNQMHQKMGCDLIMEKFEKKAAQDDFVEMLNEWNKMKTQLSDPLNSEYVLLSDKYFLNRIVKRANMKQADYIDFLDVIVVYAFQIFLKTDFDGFQLILSFLCLLYQHCQSGIIIEIKTMLLPDAINPIIQNNFEEREAEQLRVLYKLLYVVMEESLNHFGDKSIIKSLNTEDILVYQSISTKLQQQE